MRSARQLPALFMCLFSFLPPVLAQEAQSAATISKEVTIIIEQQRVRFTGRSAVEQMQLQVFNQSGEMVYDSGVVAQPEINWPLQNGAGEDIKNGLYAYRLSIKEVGAETARVRRGHFIVDRVKDRDGADKLWVTSQGDSGVGAELTVARDENATLAGAVIGGGRTLEGQQEKTSRDGSGRGVEPEAQDQAEANKAARTAAAGTVGQIAKFTSATELGDSVMSEANGNVGIGTTNPGTKLEVVSNNSSAVLGTSTSLNSNGVVGEANNGTSAFGVLGRSTSGLGVVGLSTSGYGVRGVSASGYGVNGASSTGFAGYFEGKLAVSSSTQSGGDNTAYFAATGIGPWQSHIHFGTTGDWFIRSAATAGKVVLQDNGGNVGIGTAAPATKLTVQTASGNYGLTHTDGAITVGSYVGGSQSGAAGGWLGTASNHDLHFFTNNGQPSLSIKPSGNVGIGTTNPMTRLHVESSGFAEATIRSFDERAILALSNRIGPSYYTWTVESGVRGIPGQFGIYNRTVGRSGLEIDGSLQVTVRSLRLDGGADLAENFDVRAEAAAASASGPAGAPETLEMAGMVVSIDPQNPGKLRVSNRAYDRRVAGIISGAGGVKPGMVMGQEGTLADGKHPVALSGRVYVWVDATRHAVKPGDLLTTSATPGHAMKAANPQRAQGAIIGKAMTGLKSGKGLALALITLQ